MYQKFSGFEADSETERHDVPTEAILEIEEEPPSSPASGGPDDDRDNAMESDSDEEIDGITMCPKEMVTIGDRFLDICNHHFMSHRAGDAHWQFFLDNADEIQAAKMASTSEGKREIVCYKQMRNRARKLLPKQYFSYCLRKTNGEETRIVANAELIKIHRGYKRVYEIGRINVRNVSDSEAIRIH